MSMSNEEKRNKIVAALREWEVIKGSPDYEEAVKQLADYLSVSYPENNYRCTFGEYALAADSYAILSEDQLKNAKKVLKAVKVSGKKIKIWVKVYASVNYYGREYVALVMPGYVLWEIAGASAEDAEQICKDMSAQIGIPLKIITKYGNVL